MVPPQPHTLSPRTPIAWLTRIATRRLRYQIVIPYLLLAMVLAAGATYLLTRAASQSLHDRFNQQLLDAARGGANSLAGAESHQLAGLRLMLFTQGLPEAVRERDTTTLHSLIAPLALNNGFDHVLVVAGDGSTLLDLSQPGTAPGAANMAEIPPTDLIQAALHPGAIDKISAVVDSTDGRGFYTAGPVRRGDQVIGAILVGTYLSRLLGQVQRDSLSNGATFYGPQGIPLGHTLAGLPNDAGTAPPLPGGWYATLHNDPSAPVQFRTVSLHGDTFLEATGAVPGHGLNGPPGVYGIMLSTSTLDAGLNSSLWTLVPFFGLGFILIVVIGGILAAQIDRPVAQLVQATWAVARGDLEVQVPVVRHDELGVLAARFNDMIAGLRQLLFVKDLFGRFVSPEVSAQLIAGQIKLGGEQRTVTILVSDLRDFTRLSEESPPEEIVDLLNEYFRAVVQASKQYGGIVNKFVGDSALIIFGAPVSVTHHAGRALATALAMRNALAQINVRRCKAGLAPLRQGIGITTGSVIAGQVGSEDRMEYTVIGDAVNVASRLEALTKTMPDCDIIVSGSTVAALDNPNLWQWADLGPMEVRGKAAAVHIYRLLGETRRPALTRLMPATMRREPAPNGNGAHGKESPVAIPAGRGKG
jgi:adenylate cyclase